MPVNAEISGKLYQLPTVSLRSILRWLCNNRRSVINPQSKISTMRGEDANTAIVKNFDDEDVSAAMKYVLDATAIPEPTDVPDVLRREHDKPFDPAELADDTKELDDILGETNKPNPEPPKKKSKLEEALAELGGVTEDRAKQISKEYARATVETIVPNMLVTLSKHFESLLGSKVSQTVDSLGRMVEQGITSNRKVMQDKIAELQNTLRTEMLEEIHKNKPLKLEIITKEGPKIETGIVHKDQPKLIRYLAAGVNVYLPGPAGSGKSTAAEIAATALKRPFYAISVCQQTTKVDFLGYMDAGGTYRPTLFREAYANGGIYLIDEIDKSNPNVLAVLNSALSGTVCAFPDGMVKRHKDFQVCATGNTWGGGKTLQYVGSNPIDAASLNRFVFLYWDTDENLEKSLVPDMPKWVDYVQQCRAEVKRRGIHFLITPRASLYGAQLLRAGLPQQDVINDVLLPNMDPDTLRSIPSAPESFLA